MNEYPLIPLNEYPVIPLNEYPLIPLNEYPQTQSAALCKFGILLTVANVFVAGLVHYFFPPAGCQTCPVSAVVCRECHCKQVFAVVCSVQQGTESRVIRGRLVQKGLSSCILVAALPGVWCCRVDAGTGWPGVIILRPGEMASLIFNFCLSMVAY